MEQPSLLTGHEIVAKGITKIDATLPEIGMKDVSPNGSWLEMKQIQAALEARKHLIEVERIEKCGTLSHAEWNEELHLAEVSQKAGGYWQYIGHNVGRHLYLEPEEALFLMEVNCLQLTHNDIKVSLQKAYSLLLIGTESLFKYKVYASLSRLGYRVFKHKECSATIITNSFDDNIVSKSKELGDESIDHSSQDAINVYTNEGQSTDMKIDDEFKAEVNTLSNSMNTTVETMETSNILHSNINQDSNINEDAEILNDVTMIEDAEYSQDDENNKNCSETLEADNLNGHEVEFCDNTKEIEELPSLVISDVYSIDETGTVRNTTDLTMNVENRNEESNNNQETSNRNKHSRRVGSNVNQYSHNNQCKLQKLRNRKLQPTNTSSLQKYFDVVPEMVRKINVNISVPDEKFVPKNIFVNKTTYVLDVEKITTKDTGSISVDSTSYSTTDEVNDPRIGRIRSSSMSEVPLHTPRPFFNPGYQRPSFMPNFRPFSFWRPRHNFNQFNFNNIFYQRPFFSNYYAHHRFQFPFIRPIFSVPFGRTNSNPNYGDDFTGFVPHMSKRKRRRENAKNNYFQTIKTIASRLKVLVVSGALGAENTRALVRLINSYNSRFKTKFRLTENYDLVDDENVLETIELEDEDESRSKRFKDNNDSEPYERNFNSIVALASTLKELEMKDKATPRHRRALSKVIKNFNKTFHADVYLDDDYKVNDRRRIILDSSSDSDCVINEPQKAQKKKKLRNPFNIMRRLSKKIDSEMASTSKQSESYIEIDVQDEDKSYTELLKTVFGGRWLPSENDFGRAEVVPRHSYTSRLMDACKNEYIYEFLKNQPNHFKNWLEAKISYLRHIEDTNEALREEHSAMLIEELQDGESGLSPIIKPGDCSDTRSVLDKLRIIPTNKDVNTSNLKIAFDVYNRDVQNFRKRSPPKPHFRVVCIHESTPFPSGADVAALHSDYNDNVAIVFAVVGISSISYLQINPSDLQIYIPNLDQP